MIRVFAPMVVTTELRKQHLEVAIRDALLGGIELSSYQEIYPIRDNVPVKDALQSLVDGWLRQY